MNELWKATAKDFIATNKPASWGKMEQVAVNFTAITEGLKVELSKEDRAHLMNILMAGENTSACAQVLRKAKLLAAAPAKASAGELANKYIDMAVE